MKASNFFTISKRLSPLAWTFIWPGIGHIKLGYKRYGIVMVIVYAMTLLTIIGLPIAILISTWVMLDVARIIAFQKNSNTTHEIGRRDQNS